MESWFTHFCFCNSLNQPTLLKWLATLSSNLWNIFTSSALYDSGSWNKWKCLSLGTKARNWNYSLKAHSLNNLHLPHLPSESFFIECLISKRCGLSFHIAISVWVLMVHKNIECTNLSYLFTVFLVHFSWQHKKIKIFELVWLMNKNTCMGIVHCSWWEASWEEPEMRMGSINEGNPHISLL